MTDSHFLNDLNDLDLNDRFFTFSSYLLSSFLAFIVSLQ